MSGNLIDLKLLLRLMSIELSIANGWPEVICRLEAANLKPAARVLAEGIAGRRLRCNERLYTVWQTRLTDPLLGSVESKDLQLLINGLLQNVGTPDDPADANHLHGLVAESVWFTVVKNIDTGLGLPIRVEGHDWSVTDPGGDGLTVYSIEDDRFCFRLWESKYHGSDDSIRSTVNKACRQIKNRALSYLSRFSLVAQSIAKDDELARFYGLLSELWVNHDAAAGVGISIGATDDGADGVNCFANVTNYFELDDSQHQGHLHLITNFNQFAERVRLELWRGCGLWNEP